MKSIVLALVFGVSILPLSAQTTYRSGYLITADGDRQEVEIYDQDWVSNPTDFRYRTPAGEERSADLGSVAEFGVPDRGLRYLRATVGIDRSETNLARLSQSAAVSYAESTVFLEVLVDGEADLFYYRDGDVRQFLFRVHEAQPEVLVNRRYREGNTVKEQKHYRGQLRSSLKGDFSNQDFKSLPYLRANLVQLFTEYNQSVGYDAEITVRPTPKRPFRIMVRPGVEYRSGYVIADNVFGSTTHFPVPSAVGLRLGVEGELTLAMANNRWALTGEVFGSGYQSEGVSGTDFRYASLAAAVGVRRYFYLGPESALFLNAAGVVYAPLTKTFHFRRNETSLLYNYDLTSNFGVLAGAGLKLRDRFWMEIRYDMQQDLLQSYINVSTRYRILSVIAGYRIG
ncbi:MAG: hypothetical protein WA952_11105 [Lewinella sp.]